MTPEEPRRAIAPADGPSGPRSKTSVRTGPATWPVIPGKCAMTEPASPWLHRLAVSTVCVAMVTLTAGALVTSKNAGMAFRDWPTSDGQGMLSYPWWNDFALDWDKFLEHGHRLAGVLIGCWAIVLAVAVGLYESRRWVRWLAVGILLGVIAQGVLGGFRVWLDERGLAQVHGATAAVVFTLMAILATVLSRGWQESVEAPRRPSSPWIPALAIGTVVLLTLQYLLGGLIRHHGTGLHEHLVLGLLVTLVVVINTFVADSSPSAWVGRSGWLLLGCVLLQVLLGGAAWVTRFGYGPAGYVAVADSIQQIVFRTAHTVLGIVVYMTAVVHLMRVLRVNDGNRDIALPATRYSWSGTTGGWR